MKKKLKAICFEVGVLLFVLSLASFYVGWTEYADIRDVEEYEDVGVISFAPYRVLPEQVKNYGKNRRISSTRTVYMVYYQSTNGSRYEWKKEVSSKSRGEDIIAVGAEVERRVLRIPAAGTYISIEPEQTAESYTAKLRQKYMLMMGAAVVYIVGYGIVFVVLRNQRGND